MDNDSHTSTDRGEPAGDLAGRLAALARLFASPIADEETLTAAGLDAAGITAGDEDDRAAEHYRILTHDLVPDAGVFFEADGMLGGPLARELHSLMMDQGFEPDESARSTGHIVNELGFMAHLVRSRRADVLAAFWFGHASGWMPLVSMVLRRSDAPPFEALGQAMDVALADIELSCAGEMPAEPSEVPLIPSSLPFANLDLDEPKVGLSRIGRFLSIPSHSGLALTRSRIAWIGRSFRLPTGFGSRARIIEGLLRSGAEYKGWEAVCDALLEDCEAAEHCWRNRPSSPWAPIWEERLTVTRTVLQRLKEAEASIHS